MLKYPSCPICKAIKEQTKASDRQINAYHESEGSYEIFDKRDQDIVIEIVMNDPRKTRYRFFYPAGEGYEASIIIVAETPTQARKIFKRKYPNIDWFRWLPEEE